MSKKIKLGVNAGNAFSIPVAVPRISRPAKTQFDLLDVKQFAKNSADGLVVSDADYVAMRADPANAANIDALIAARLIVVE